VKESMSPKSVSGTSDDYETLSPDDFLRRGDDQMCPATLLTDTFNPIPEDKIGKKVRDVTQHNFFLDAKWTYRRKVSKSDLQKKVEELEVQLNDAEETIKLQRCEIEVSNNQWSKCIDTVQSQKREIEELKSAIMSHNKTILFKHPSENARLKSENSALLNQLESMTVIADDRFRIIQELKVNLDQTKADLAQGRREIEELKKQLPRWEKDAASEYLQGKVFIRDNGVVVYLGQYSIVIPHTPKPPQQPAIDPAEEAWDEYVNAVGSHEKMDEISFKAGFNSKNKGLK